MSIKPTSLGAAVPETGSKLAPTSLGGLGAGGLGAGGPAPATQGSAIRPTVFKPTAMPGTAPAMPPEASSMPKPAAAPAEPVKASALPGTQRKALDVSYAQLALRFPGKAPDLIERTKAILAGISPQTMSTPAWLAFGKPAQEEQATLVKERLALMEAPGAKSVVQHLARLHTLLQEIVDALGGGFLKKPALKVWESVRGEVGQLEGLLSNAEPGLAAAYGEMDRLANKNKEVGDSLQANALAAEYLIDILDPEVGQLMVSRLTSLSTSQARAIEQVQTLALDKEHVQELMTLVQNGVLLQLPAVYSQLAGLSAKPSDTERYLATDKLNEIVQIIQRKL